MVVAMLMPLPGDYFIAKLVSNAILASQTAWAQFFFQVFILAPFVVWHGNLK